MDSPNPAPSRRFVVAMSGGVDSSVAALLLSREGFDVIGLFMRNGVQVSEEESRHKSCCSAGDARDARMVAAHLGLPFQAVDLSREFEHIVRAFIDEYSAGRTPNPCAICNRDLKFDRLLSFAEELGAEGVATGHYARLDIEDGRVVVRRGVDHTKDQSYQLFCVAEEHLARTRLPLGALEKSAVRELAREAGLRTAAKADSQEICFVPSGDYRKLLAERGVELHPGKLLDTAGKVLGEHPGTEHFTVGQRRGHGVGGGTPLYVVEVNPGRGTVVLGTRAEACFESLEVGAVNWIGFEPPASGELTCLVQVRYGSEAVGARVILARGAEAGSGARVVFDEPQPAVAAGQGAAFYLADRLLGGGWIRSAERVEAVAPAAP
jgi:tRNA-specific 2-thiouridylase